ncbi:hypothetical protein [Paenibacillus sp. YN15]|uniref:hypothetical protein n=1 Tax=Paenibacillus sp. YN15 TaxID=1742774 RepID=UPI000DCBC6CF|nr:hypothetical protein [Paenibacillus sp. YN15]RAV02654.1 hypothetical protein DQG13_09090 [Paenibacillus sp. YN15]
MRKKMVSFMLAFMLIFTSGVAVAQANTNTLVSGDGIVVPYYDYISFVGATISIDSGGRSTSTGYVFYTDNYDSMLTVELQRSDGTGWSTVKSWSDSFSGSGYKLIEEDYYVFSGYTYRVVTTAAIKSGNVILEIASSTSSSVEY